MSSAEKSDLRFISLRWRLILPTFAIVLILAMASAYVVAHSLPSDGEMSRVNVLLNTGRAAVERANTIADSQQSEAERLAQLPEVAASLSEQRAADLRDLLENFARRDDFDVVVVSDGQSSYGVERSSDGTYAPVTLETAQAILSAAPIDLDGQPIGSAQVGISMARWLDEVRASAAAEVALYTDSHLLATTTAANTLPPVVPEQFIAAEGDQSFQALDLDGTLYLGAYYPLNEAGMVVGVFVPNNAPFAAEAAQQLIALTLATVAAGIVITLFVMTTYFLERVSRVRQVAEALASGELGARTNMQPTDEIGALGHALDLYSEQAQQRHDKLRASLRRQRREVEHLNAVLESLPDGVVIQDLDGNVTFINERAKHLIGEGYNFFKRAELRDITAAVTDVLGPALAPGLHPLGTPHRIELDGRTVSTQVLVVMSLADQRVGRVILVRDVTEEVQRERASTALLELMVENVEKPLNAEAAFAHEIKRHVGTLQKLIVEMRELIAGSDVPLVQQTNRSLPLETLIWAVANEWRQVAQAANLTLTVTVEQPSLQVFGDERRLRWAIGNIVDNAIKYTPPGGKVSVEIKGEEEGFARLRIRDNGVGIAPEDLPQVFARFFRGHPVSANGRALRVPGTGQGLTIARQIIEAHSGRIYVRSSPQIGTAVYFTLPMTENPVRLDRLEDENEEETLRLEDGAGVD